MKKNKMIFPIVINTSFGLTVSEESQIKEQFWFVSFSDFFGNIVVWVDRSSYYQAYNFIADFLNLDVLCV